MTILAATHPHPTKDTDGKGLPMTHAFTAVDQCLTAVDQDLTSGQKVLAATPV